MKVVLWIGNDANQKALANKIAAVLPIDGIVIETKISKQRSSVSNLLGKIIARLFLPSIAKSWWKLQEHYIKEYPNYPATKLLNIENINAQNVYDFTKEINPDLILVSGTRLIKENLLSLQPTIGIINLHTGLSPYIKGGPNCTNWCIATKEFHLIGNTVMWLDLGIDTGNIITTEYTEFVGNENLTMIHFKVMEHAHNLYLKALQSIKKGMYSNVKQNDISPGKTYYTKQWNLSEKIRLVKNVKKFQKAVKTGETKKLRTFIKTISID
jgi:methionyl-tRNA formyltransferase